MGRAPKLLEKTQALPLEDGHLRIVVVADTHSSPHPRCVERVTAERPHRILHAGDIGDLAVLATLRAIAPTSAVRGNIDVHADEIPDRLTLDVTDGGETLFKMLLLHIAVNGPKLRADAARAVVAAGARVVVCGHSHVPFIGRDRGITLFNPGSVGPRRFHLPILYGVIDVRRDRVDMKHVDCETGEAWLPP